MPDVAEQPPQPTDRRGRRIYVYWAIALTLLALLGIFCWAVVVPVRQVHSALDWQVAPVVAYSISGDNYYVKNRTAARGSIEKLGGSSTTARRVLRYVLMPKWLASRREQAARVLAECGTDAVPLLLDALPVSAESERPFVEMAFEHMQDNDEAEKRVIQELGNPDAERRYWAALALGFMHSYAGKDSLRKLLDDESARVREAARRSLKILGAEVDK